MGAETYLYLNTDSHSFIARVDAHTKVSIGSVIELPVYMPKTHIFNAETENLII
jgi:multiple sugar transport system ATP-binding protein